MKKQKTSIERYRTISIPSINYDTLDDCLADYKKILDECFNRTIEEVQKKLEGILKKMEGNDIEKRTYLDFKVGDLVKIRSWEDMAEQYGVNSVGIKTNEETWFTKEMRKYCGTKLVITNRENGFIDFRVKGKEENLKHYTVTTGMIEIVEENYVQKMQEKLKETKEETKQETKDEIIEEMISKVDKTKMLRILAGSFNIPQFEIKGLDKLLKDWANAKYQFYLMLDKKLKIEQDVELEKDVASIKQELRELCDSYPIFSYVYCNLRDNEIQQDTYYGSCYALHRTGKIEEGMKLSRFLSIVMNNKDFDIDFSKIYQDKTIKETIAISIDPVDYLTMSMNMSGWDSCHRLHDMNSKSSVSYGCYSAGVFSYLCDKCSLVAYKHSPKIFDFYFNKFKVKDYSKNWREMFYYDLNTNAFISSRQYPYTSEQISKKAREILEETVSKKFDFENKWKVTRKNGCTYINDNTDLHYDDVVEGMGTYAICKPEHIDESQIHFSVGSDAVCPICGDNYLQEHEYPVCNSCYDDFLD